MDPLVKKSLDGQKVGAVAASPSVDLGEKVSSAEAGKHTDLGAGPAESALGTANAEAGKAEVAATPSVENDVVGFSAEAKIGSGGLEADSSSLGTSSSSFGTGSGGFGTGSSGFRASEAIVSGGNDVDFGMSETISSGTGDIVLASSGERKSKKGLIIGILAAVVLLVGGIVGGVMLIGGEEKVDLYINRYLNLFSIGEDKTDKPSNDQLLNFETSEIELKNVYTIPRYYDPLSKENTNYYNNLVDLLSLIEGEVIKDGKYSEEERSEIAFLANNSKNMLSRYFVASVLGYTNAGYDYYMEHKNFDGFLSIYGYPFEESEENILADFEANISIAYETQQIFYEEISKTKCMTTQIDYACLMELNSERIENLQENNIMMMSIEADQANEMYEILAADMKMINNIANGASNE